MGLQIFYWKNSRSIWFWWKAEILSIFLQTFYFQFCRIREFSFSWYSKLYNTNMEKYVRHFQIETIEMNRKLLLDLNAKFSTTICWETLGSHRNAIWTFAEQFDFLAFEILNFEIQSVNFNQHSCITNFQKIENLFIKRNSSGTSIDILIQQSTWYQ